MGTYSELHYEGGVPSVVVPRDYNASSDFIDRHSEQGRGGNIALIDETGRYTYARLGERVNRAGNALRAAGAQMETRVVMCMLDGIDFPADEQLIANGRTTEDTDFVLEHEPSRRRLLNDWLGGEVTENDAQVAHFR